MDFDLVEQLKVSLFENSIDVAIDFAEIGLDNLLSDITDSEILQEIPIIKTIYSVCKVGLAIQEKHLLKKTLVLIKVFNSKQIKPKKLEKYKKIFKDKNNYINFAKYSENIKSIKNISRNEKSICRTTLQNIRWEGTGKHFFHIIK